MLSASKSESDTPAQGKSARTCSHGQSDPDFKQPQVEAEWIAQQLHTDYKMIQGAGHYPHAEMPDTVAPLIIDYFDSIQKGEQNGASVGLARAQVFAMPPRWLMRALPDRLLCKHSPWHSASKSRR